jgi:hypothetical protein
MPRLFTACLVLGLWCHAAASGETPSPVNPALYVPNSVPKIKVAESGETLFRANPIHYAATIKLKGVKQKQTIGMDTELAGTRGTPLKFEANGVPTVNGRCKLKIEIQDVPGSKPTQYVAQFKWIEIEKSGKENTVAAPKITTLGGTPAKLTFKTEDGDPIEIELKVREIASAPNNSKPPSMPNSAPYDTNPYAPKPTMPSVRLKTNLPAPQKPAIPVVPNPVPSNVGQSLMKMVHPRIILIQNEDEELQQAPTP